MDFIGEIYYIAISTFYSLVQHLTTLNTKNLLISLIFTIVAITISQFQI